MVRISGYGQTGPYRDRPGFARIAEAMGGLRYVTGYPDRAPVRTGVSLGDTLAALYAVIGALIALHHRHVNGGKGQVVDVALYEAVFAVMESLMPEFSRLGFVRERSGGEPSGHRAVQHLSLRRRQLRRHRGQQRRHLQAADAGDRPRRPRRGSGARRQRGARRSRLT